MKLKMVRDDRTGQCSFGAGCVGVGGNGVLEEIGDAITVGIDEIACDGAVVRIGAKVGKLPGLISVFEDSEDGGGIGAKVSADRITQNKVYRFIRLGGFIVQERDIEEFLSRLAHAPIERA